MQIVDWPMGKRGVSDRVDARKLAELPYRRMLRPVSQRDHAMRTGDLLPAIRLAHVENLPKTSIREQSDTKRAPASRRRSTLERGTNAQQLCVVRSNGTDLLKLMSGEMYLNLS
jgi:hypothetical protein